MLGELLGNFFRQAWQDTAEQNNVEQEGAEWKINPREVMQILREEKSRAEEVEVVKQLVISCAAAEEARFALLCIKT